MVLTGAFRVDSGVSRKDGRAGVDHCSVSSAGFLTGCEVAGSREAEPGGVEPPSP